MSPFYKWGNGGSERLSDLTKVTQRVSGRLGSEPGDLLSFDQCPFHHIHQPSVTGKTKKKKRKKKSISLLKKIIKFEIIGETNTKWKLMIIKNWCCGVVKVLIFQKYILKYLQMNDIISKICFKIIQWGQEWREVGRNLDETRLLNLHLHHFLASYF